MHFGRYGAPYVLLSDRGSHFVNSVISEFLLHVGSEHSLIIAYFKQENSIVEIANKEINRHLTALFFDRRVIHLWRKCLPLAQRILNSNYFERSGISPADLLFGNALNLDRGIFLSNEETILSEPQPLSARMAQLLKLQSDLIAKHRQILMEKDSQHLVNSSAGFAVDSYVLLEPVTGP